MEGVPFHWLMTMQLLIREKSVNEYMVSLDNLYVGKKGTKSCGQRLNSEQFEDHRQFSVFA